MKKRIKGSPKRPRLYVFKSSKHIYAQIIDDFNNKILVSSSTISKDIKQHGNCINAKIVGKQIGEKLKNKGLYEIVFDRGNNIYHGQIKALADATRAEGIKF